MFLHVLLSKQVLCSISSMCVYMLFIISILVTLQSNAEKVFILHNTIYIST